MKKNKKLKFNQFESVLFEKVKIITVNGVSNHSVYCL